MTAFLFDNISIFKLCFKIREREKSEGLTFVVCCLFRPAFGCCAPKTLVKICNVFKSKKLNKEKSSSLQWSFSCFSCLIPSWNIIFHKQTYVDPMVPNQSNVAEPMSETVKSIESRGIERVLIERWTIDRRSTIDPC